jgi:uncharacterized protein
MTTIIGTGDVRAVAATDAIHRGDTDRLRHLLAEHPELASAAIGACRSLLHVATDWPGHHPRVAATIAVLVQAGADVNARFTGPHTETPLTAEHLLRHGADLNWVSPWDGLTPLDAARRSDADGVAGWLVAQGATTASDAP